MRSVRVMKRLGIVLPVVFALALLGGCTSTGFLGFLATTDQVDKKLAAQNDETQTSIDQLDSDIKTLQDDVAKFKDQTDQINTLLQQTQELQQLASTVEGRLASLPRETLLELSDMIQKALASGAGAPGASGAAASGAAVSGAAAGSGNTGGK
jgi:outer membrane murein-binding lipoprotein Lpp